MSVRKMQALLAVACAGIVASTVPNTSAVAQQPATKPATTITKSRTKAATAASAPHAMKLSAAVTARCGDSTWSKAASEKGACSSHGGVARWYGKAPRGTTARCNDGEFSRAADTQGACSDHGGVAYWTKRGRKAHAAVKTKD